MLTLIPQLVIGATDLVRGLSVHVRPEAHVVAGDGAVGNSRRGHRHAGRRAGELPLRLRRRRGRKAASCWSISAWPWRPCRSAAACAWWVGRKVAMTAMPQMVAIYNGMGGGAAGAIAAVELFGSKTHGATQLVVTLLGALIGAVSLSGSLIAWAKLHGRDQEAAAGEGPADRQRGWSCWRRSRSAAIIVFATGRGAIC